MSVGPRSPAVSESSVWGIRTPWLVVKYSPSGRARNWWSCCSFESPSLRAPSLVVMLVSSPPSSGCRFLCWFRACRFGHQFLHLRAELLELGSVPDLFHAPEDLIFFVH